MLLQSKTAIIYGASGNIGSAVARTYAREGAAVHLVGRTEGTLARIAKEIRAAGGSAEIAALDVLDHDAVVRHAGTVAQANGIDVVFNATSNADVQGTPLLEMRLDPFVRPVVTALTAHFNIATAVGPHMIGRGAGTILVMAGGREAIPKLGGSHVAWAALAGLCRQLASELGQHGVRVCWLLSPGSPDVPAPDSHSAAQGHEIEAESPPPDNGGLLARHQPSYEEVAGVAAFAASDWARTMTATEINVTGGAVVD